MIQTKDPKKTKGQKPKTKDQRIEIACRQRPARINFKNMRIVLREILQLLGLKSFCISVVFCDNKFISKLNRKFFKKSRATDVISFPLRDDEISKYLGEIVISVEQAKRMCDFYGKKWREELTLYLIHGILHLVGYNDIKKKERTIMERKQEEILSELLKKHKKTVQGIG